VTGADPAYAEAWALWALAQCQIHYRYGVSDDTGIAAAERALSINPEFTDAHVNLGSLLFSRGRVRDALPHFQRAVELEPGSPMLLNNLAGGLAASGRFPEAMQYVRRALAIDPGYQPALDNLRRLQGMGIR
jgi:tetratricopeptide (TPR) repeat protein